MPVSQIEPKTLSRTGIEARLTRAISPLTQQEMNNLIKWIKSGINSSLSSGINSSVNSSGNYVS